MKATLKSTVILATFLVLATAGCGGEEPAAPGAAGDTGILPSDMGAKMGEAIRESADALAKEYAQQLDQQESQLKSLKASAQTLADDELNKLLGAIEKRLVAARDKLKELQNADEGSVQALGGELKSQMGVLQKLYEQALDRVGQLKGT
jgi:hypothetical protein